MSPGCAAAIACSIAARRSASATTERSTHPPAPRARRHGPGHDLGDDRVGVLRARVVGGDDRDIGEPRGDLAHQRALAAVAVAAGAEDAEDAPAAVDQLARGAQDVLERVGGVGVVDEHREVLTLLDGLEAPRHPHAARERGEERVEVAAERVHRGERAERVGDVEAPGQRQRQPALTLRGPQTQAAAVEADAHVERAVVGVAVDREGDRVGELGGEPPAVGVVDVDHADARARGRARRRHTRHLGAPRRRARGSRVRYEQPPLGQEVALHGGVEVEVVLGQVGEDRSGEAHAGRAAQLQSVRGDLHRAGALAAIEHRAEVSLQVDRLGGGAGDGTLGPADEGRDGAQQPARASRGLQQRAHEEGGGRLAVGAGYADDVQLGSRVAEEARGDRPHRSARGGDEHLGHAESQRTLDDERGRPRLHGRGGEVVAVAAQARDTEEQRPGRDPTAVVGQALDLDRAGGCSEPCAQLSGHELRQLHRSTPRENTDLSLVSASDAEYPTPVPSARLRHPAPDSDTQCPTPTPPRSTSSRRPNRWAVRISASRPVGAEGQGLAPAVPSGASRVRGASATSSRRG